MKTRISDEQARRLYEDDGLTSYQIADRFGYSFAGILAKVRRAGGVPRPTGRNSRAQGWHLHDGYVMEIVSRDWPHVQMARKHGRSLVVPQHRRVMADALGRPLSRNETVHHRNGNKADNRIENLQLRQGRHGKGVAFVCRSCGSTDVVEADL